MFSWGSSASSLRDSGLQVIDVSNPATPVWKGTYDTPDYALGVAISGTTAYVADDASGLQVIDNGFSLAYSYTVDQSALTVPDAIPEGSLTATTLAGVADGVWFFHVRPVLAGRAGATSYVRIMVDSTAPTLTISATPSWVSLAAIDSYSGVTGIWYRIDGGAPQLYTGLPFSPGLPGRHTITAWTSDRAGNVTAATSEVTVDADAPTVSDDAPADWRTADTTVTLSAADPLSSIASVDWVLTGATTGLGSAAASPAKVPITAEGTTTIEYSAIDTAGNRCATKTATVRIDKGAPSTGASHVPGLPGVPATVTLSGTDALSGVASTWFRIGSGPSSIYEGPFAVSTVGTTTVTYWSDDAAGNTEISKSTNVHIDVPVVPTVTRATGATRFDVAANLARKGWDPTGTKAWTGVTHIIVASGEDGKEADPLSAAGLAGAYDAPVLLCQAGKLPASTRAVIAEIASKNPGVRVHIIGGTASVPDARWNEIRAISGVSSVKDRIAGADRYSVSAAIANRIVSLKGAPAR